jgi:glycosyltransferase involved in cell wall biosynthesis
MTVYNGEKFLRASISSVLSQTYDDWELIVVDDGSNDSTFDILKSYSDPRIKVLHFGQNRKQAVCSNRALSVASGRYVARLDADDISLPNRLLEQVIYMEANPDVVLVASAAHEINQEGVRVGFLPGGLGNCELKMNLVSGNPIIHSSVMYRANAVRELNGYNEEERYWFSEDYELWSRFALSGKMVVLSQPLIEYRVHPTSVSTVNSREQIRQAECVARISLERISGREVDDRTWSAWCRFTKTKPGCAAAFDADEVRCLRLLISGMIQRVQHDRRGQCKHPWPWAKHALALALLRRGDIPFNARIGLVSMALHVCFKANIAHL